MYRNIPTFLSLVTVTKMGLDIDKVGAVTYNHINTEHSPSTDFLESLGQFIKERYIMFLIILESGFRNKNSPSVKRIVFPSKSIVSGIFKKENKI